MDPNPATTYLNKATVQSQLQVIERDPEESTESSYRSVMVSILKYFFTKEEDFDVVSDGLRGLIDLDESNADVAVLKVTGPPGGRMYVYDYNLAESKAAGNNWSTAEDHLRRHSAATVNPSRQVYGTVQVGVLVRFYIFDGWMLMPLSGILHLRNDAHQITAMFEAMRNNPVSFT